MVQGCIKMQPASHPSGLRSRTRIQTDVLSIMASALSPSFITLHKQQTQAQNVLLQILAPARHSYGTGFPEYLIKLSLRDRRELSNNGLLRGVSRLGSLPFESYSSDPKTSERGPLGPAIRQGFMSVTLSHMLTTSSDFE